MSIFPWSKVSKSNKLDDEKSLETKEEDDDEEENNKEESDEEENDEEENEDESSEMFGELIDDIGGKYKIKLYKGPYEKILDIKSLDCNRKLVPSHVKEIKLGILKNKCLPTPLKIAKDKYDHYSMLDGHHRKEALRQIYKENKDFHITIRIELYEVDNIKDKDFNELYRIANNIIKFDLNDLPQLVIDNAVIKLKSYYPKLIKIKRKNKVRIPAIDRNILYNGLRDSKIAEDFKLDADDIKNVVININNWLSEQEQSYFDSDKKMTDSIFKDAKRKKFYLGLKTNKDGDYYNWFDKLRDFAKKYKKR